VIQSINKKGKKMRTQKNFKKGFTLVEMMIVVAIIAILAGIAVPQYTKYVMKSKAAEPSRFMKQIADAEVTYYSTHSKKYVKGDTGPLGVDIPTSTMFDYNVTTDANQTNCFTVYAVGKVTSGDVSGRVISLVYPDHNQTLCVPAKSTSTKSSYVAQSAPDGQYWDGNIYFGEYYR
jgi:prepilin-type N-terminal cleavage/methylation domain-containing protein